VHHTTTSLYIFFNLARSVCLLMGKLAVAKPLQWKALPTCHTTRVAHPGVFCFGNLWHMNPVVGGCCLECSNSCCSERKTVRCVHVKELQHTMLHQEQGWTTSIDVCCLEVYNDTVRDLLDDRYLLVHSLS